MFKNIIKIHILYIKNDFALRYVWLMHLSK